MSLVLIVEDNDRNLKLVRDVLQAKGYATLEAGADDFLSKSINQQELFARVRSLLRIKRLQDEVRDWNAKLEERVREQVAQLERLGRLVVAHGGTLERVAGDSIMVFFNDPVPMQQPAREAMRMAREAQREFAPLGAAWAKRGFELALGVGIAQGYATLGAIGFEGRWDYAAIGGVTNLAARLCAEAKAGEVFLCQRTMAAVDGVADLEPVGPLTLRGFTQPTPAFRLKGLKS